MLQPKQAVSCTIDQQTMAVLKEVIQVFKAVGRRVEMTRLALGLAHMGIDAQPLL